MNSREETTVPEGFEPPWRDIPALAWVAARAYAPRTWPPRAARCVAGCSLLVWAPLLVCLRTGRVLAATERKALMSITPADGRPRPHLSRVLAVGVALWICAVVGVVAVGVSIAYVLMWAGVGPRATIFLVSALVVGPVFVAVASVRPWQIIRSLAVAPAAARTLRKQAPGAAVWQLGSLAAWPERAGHGTALVAGLLRAWGDGGYAVARPRDRQVARWYLRLGMQELPSKRALYIELPQQAEGKGVGPMG